VQLIAGDADGALETQKRCGKAMMNLADGIPFVGHAKGLIHYAVGDVEGGDKAMKSSSRTTGVMLGGAGGFLTEGPVGAVAGGIEAGNGTSSGNEDEEDNFFEKMKKVCESAIMFESIVSINMDRRVALLTRNLPPNSQLRDVNDCGPVTRVATRAVNGEEIVDYVRASITPEHIGTGLDVTAAIRTRMQRLGIRGDNAGHIIGRILGGRHRYNFFPLNPNINKGCFRSDFERSVRKFLEKYKNQNARADVQVRLLYNDRNSTRPSNIVILVRYYIGDRLATTIELRDILHWSLCVNPYYEEIVNPPPHVKFPPPDN
jgi:hypothetical protein